MNSRIDDRRFKRISRRELLKLTPVLALGAVPAAASAEGSAVAAGDDASAAAAVVVVVAPPARSVLTITDTDDDAKS